MNERDPRMNMTEDEFLRTLDPELYRNMTPGEIEREERRAMITDCSETPPDSSSRE